MKILVVSSNYPPYHSGGYEIRISEVVKELANRGHQISIITTKPAYGNKANEMRESFSVDRVLTSNHRKPKLLADMTNHRLTRALALILIFTKEIKADLHDLKIIGRAVNEQDPDIIYLGYILPITRALFPYLAGLKIPVVLDDGGATLVLIQEDKGLWFRFIHELSFPKSVKLAIIKFIVWLSSGKLKSSWSWPVNLSVLFKREANQKAATEKKVPFKHSYILHTGVDPDLFTFRTREQIKEPINIIYPARIEPRKGQLDAIRLVAELSKNKISSRLSLIGSMRPTFQEQIEKEIERLEVGSKVKIVPKTSHADLVDWFQKADICFFPTYWKDGLSRVPLEAMACGSVIISYGNEGSSEIIENGKNGFLVKEQNYQQVVDVTRGLLKNPSLVHDITQQARKDVESEYSLGVYVNRIEEVLKGIIT